MKINLVILALFTFCAFRVQADQIKNLTQIPENCLETKKTPCLIKSDEKIDKLLLGKKNIISLYKKTLVKFDQFDDDKIKMDLVKGSVTLDYGSKEDLEINGNSVGKNDFFFVSHLGNQIKLYRSKKSEFLSFNSTKSINETSVDVEVGEFPTKDRVIQFISSFVGPEQDLYRVVIEQHAVRLKDESHQQQIYLQRKIAMEEEAKKSDAEARRKKEVNDKKLKDLFFMRTFKQ